MRREPTARGSLRRPRPSHPTAPAYATATVASAATHHLVAQASLTSRATNRTKPAPSGIPQPSHPAPTGPSANRNSRRTPPAVPGEPTAPARTLHLAPDWTNVKDQGRQQTNASASAPAVTPRARSISWAFPATIEPVSNASARTATAITDGGARAPMRASSRPNGATSATSPRQPGSSCGDANGASRVARQTRATTNGMPAKATSAWRSPAAIPFQTRGRPR